jgi:hypothetical protein
MESVTKKTPLAVPLKVTRIECQYLVFSPHQDVLCHRSCRLPGLPIRWVAQQPEPQT